MRRDAILIAGLLLVATLAGCTVLVPSFNFGYVRVLVGETSHAVEVTPRGNAVWPAYKAPWIFYSSNPEVALVEGRMDSPGTVAPAITGVSPGMALLRVEGFGEFYSVNIEVACGNEDPVKVATGSIDVRVGQPVTIEALTPIAHRTAFFWYSGRVGDRSHSLPANGPVLTFTPQEIGMQYAWVEATTPCSSSSSEVAIDVHGLRRRMVRS